MARKPRYTWEQNLRLLADEGRPVKSAAGYTEWDAIPRKELAARLGVSPRTLRRWLNEGGTPSPENQRRIQAKGAGRRRALKAAGYPDLPRIPYGHRRKLREYKSDKFGRPTWTGIEYDSPWINYHVEGWSVAEMLSFISQAYGFGNILQIIYRINHGERKGEQGATRLRDLDSFTIEEIRDEIDHILYQYMSDDEDDEEPNEIIWIGLLQRPEHKRYI